MTYEQGEIIVVPFPFSDLTSVKMRPVLVLSKKSDNIASEDIVTCGITSNIKESKHSVLIENKNLEFGKIPVASRIKVDKLFTINKRLAEKSVGKISKDTFDKVRREFFGLL